MAVAGYYSLAARGATSDSIQLDGAPVEAMESEHRFLLKNLHNINVAGDDVTCTNCPQIHLGYPVYDHEDIY